MTERDEWPRSIAEIAASEAAERAAKEAAAVGIAAFRRSLVKPVGASDGCGTVVVDTAAMARKIKALEKRNADLETALRGLTTNVIHDAICQCFEEWRDEHAAFDRAQALLSLADFERNGGTSLEDLKCELEKMK